jgi:hypothetical protein
MAIDPRIRRFLDEKGIVLVRARFIKEMAVTGDTDEEMQKEISFGTQKMRVSDLAEWLAEAAQTDSNWRKATGIAAVAAAVIAFLAGPIALCAWIFPITSTAPH